MKSRTRKSVDEISLSLYDRVMKRSRAERRRARKRWLAKQAEESATAESLAAATGESVIDQPHGMVASSRDLAESAFAPQGIGVGPSIERDRWLEIRAVNEHWPVGRAMRERLVYESMAVVLDKDADPKLRQRERWILHKMDMANRQAGLPTQLTVNLNSNQGFDMGAVIRAMHSDPLAIEAMDVRSFKPAEGSEDDYSE